MTQEGLSYPDITLLPLLATYFHVSVDELLGYEPQLDKLEIKRIYQELAEAFGNEAFETVMERCKNLTKKYYGCFPFLLQMANLYQNHHSIAQDKERQEGVLWESITLCEHIIKECADVSLVKDAVYQEAFAYISMKMPTEALERLDNPRKPMQAEAALCAVAYIMLGEKEKALDIVQISTYQYLIFMMCMVPQMISLSCEYPQKVDEILNRANGIAELFQMDSLHANTMANIYMTGAVYYADLGQEEKTLEYIERFAKITQYFSPFELHGDEFFDRIDEWIKTFALGKAAPKNMQLVRESILEAVEKTPAFAFLKNHVRYKAALNLIKKNLEE